MLLKLPPHCIQLIGEFLIQDESDAYQKMQPGQNSNQVAPRSLVHWFNYRRTCQWTHAWLSIRDWLLCQRTSPRALCKLIQRFPLDSRVHHLIRSRILKNEWVWVELGWRAAVSLGNVELCRCFTRWWSRSKEVVSVPPNDDIDMITNVMAQTTLDMNQQEQSSNHRNRLLEEGRKQRALQQWTLDYAVRHSMIPLLRCFLLEMNWSMDANTGEELMELASSLGDLTLVRLFVEECGVDPRSHQDIALRWAATNGHLSVVEYLVLYGQNGGHLNEGDVKVGDAKGIAIKKGDNPVEQEQKRHKDALIRKEQVQKVNAQDGSVLSGAALNGHLAICQFLLNHGAIVSLHQDRAIRLASIKGHDTIVKLLLSHYHGVQRRSVQKRLVGDHLHHQYLERVQSGSAGREGEGGKYWSMRVGSIGEATREQPQEQPEVDRGDEAEEEWNEEET